MKTVASTGVCLWVSLFASTALGQYGGQQYGGQPYGQSPQGAQPYGAQPYGAQPYGGQQPGTSLQSGGLSPPQPMPANGQSAQTERRLEESEKADSGRGLEFFYLNAEIGVEHLGLETFSANKLVDAGLVKTTQTGLLIGAGLGLRLVFITIGPRFRLATFEDFDLWTLGAELGLRIPVGSVEPYFVIGGGYAAMGSPGSDALSKRADISGAYGRFGGGLDLYLTDVFSLGASVTGEAVGLSRPGVNIADVQDPGTPANEAEARERSADIYRADGSGVGFGVTGTVVLGLHF